MRSYVVIFPLDWGMGHITRMIPIGEHMRSIGYKVVFAIPKKYEYLIKEYKFRTIYIRGYHVKYYSKLSPLFSLILQIPKFIVTAITEIFFVRRLEKKNCRLIISDNRPFVRSSSIFSVYVTHQVNIKSNYIFTSIIKKIHHKIIRKFDCCLIPDTSNHQFSGDLTNPILKNVETLFLGPLSRFHKPDLKCIEQNKYDLAVIASGPDPYKANFVKSVVNVIKELKGDFVIIGCPDNIDIPVNNIKIKSHLDRKDFAKVLMQSKKILSLAGYTTIMDMAVLNKSLIILPTKRQGEQEYLAEYHKKSKRIYSISNINEIENLINEKLEDYSEDYAEELEIGMDNLMLKMKNYYANR